MNQLLFAVLTAGAACMLICVAGSPATNFEYGDLIFEFADNSTNTTSSTPSSSSNATSPSPSSNATSPSPSPSPSPSSNSTSPSPSPSSNSTTPSTGNSTTPSTGNSSSTIASSTMASSTTAVVTTTVAGNVTAAPSTEGFDAGSFFGGMGAMVGVVALVGVACVCLRRSKKGYNAM